MICFCHKNTKVWMEFTMDKINDNVSDSTLKEYIQQNASDFIKAFRNEICKHITNLDVAKIVESTKIAMALWICKEELFRGIEKDKITLFGFVENEDIVDFECEDGECKKAFLALLQKKEKYVLGYNVVNDVGVSREALKTIRDYNVMWVAFFENKPKESEKYIGRVVADLFGEYLESEKNLKRLSDFNRAKFNKCFPQNSFDFMARYMRGLESELRIPAIDMITRIALMKYEKLENDAKLYFVDDELFAQIKEKKGKFVEIRKESYLEKSFQDENSISGIRKLLEICKGSNRCLIAKHSYVKTDSTEMKTEECYDIVGILQNDSDIEGKSKIVSIYFIDGEWSLYCGKELLLKYKNGKYYVGNQSVNVNLEKKCEELKLNPKFAELINNVRDSVSHGALIIVAEDAEDEVEILCNEFKRGTQIEKIQISKDNQDLLIGIASIDGAVFMDDKLNCYGFGIILDGLAKVKGEVGRGSRYNSSLNYIHNSNKKRWAVVFSEDKEKGIDIISNENREIRMIRKNIDNNI